MSNEIAPAWEESEVNLAVEQYLKNYAESFKPENGCISHHEKVMYAVSRIKVQNRQVKVFKDLPEEARKQIGKRLREIELEKAGPKKQPLPTARLIPPNQIQHSVRTTPKKETIKTLSGRDRAAGEDDKPELIRAGANEWMVVEENSTPDQKNLF